VLRPLRAPGVRVARPLVSRAASSWPAAIRLVPAAVAIWAAVAPGAAASAAQTAAAGSPAGGPAVGAGGGDAAVCVALCGPLPCAVFFLLAAHGVTPFPGFPGPGYPGLCRGFSCGLDDHHSGWRSRQAVGVFISVTWAAEPVTGQDGA
jgi:hypothetical protein